MQACFAILQQDATKQQSAPGSTASKNSPTVLKPPAMESVAANKADMHLPQDKTCSECHTGYDTVGKVRQASTQLETSRAITNTDKQYASTTEKKEVAGAYTPAVTL